MPARPQWIELSAQKRAELLDQTGWSRVFRWQELLTLAPFLRAVKYNDGDIVFCEGDRDRSLYFVVAGRISVRKKRADGRSMELGVVRAHRLLGEMSLVDTQPRSATAVVQGDCLLCVLSQPSFDRLGEEYPRLWGKLLKQIAELTALRLRALNGEYVQLHDERDEAH